MNKKGQGMRVLTILASVGLIILVFVGFYMAFGLIPGLGETRGLEIKTEISDLNEAGQLRLILAQSADDIAQGKYEKVSNLVGQVFGSEAKYSLSINNNRVSGTSLSGETASIETKLPRYDQEILSVKLEVFQ